MVYYSFVYRGSQPLFILWSKTAREYSGFVMVSARQAAALPRVPSPKFQATKIVCSQDIIAR